MLLSAVSVSVVAQSSSEIPEGLMNHPVLFHIRSLCMVAKQQDSSGHNAFQLWLQGSNAWNKETNIA
jgi:hypothetical protein